MRTIKMLCGLEKVLITEQDIKALKGQSDLHFKLVQGLLISGIFLQLFFCYHSLSVAISYGKAMGLDFEAILAMWNAEPQLDRIYSGYEIQSLHRLTVAILNFGSAIIISIIVYGMIRTRSRNKRILEVIEKE